MKTTKWQKQTHKKSQERSQCSVEHEHEHACIFTSLRQARTQADDQVIQTLFFRSLLFYISFILSFFYVFVYFTY